MGHVFKIAWGRRIGLHRQNPSKVGNFGLPKIQFYFKATKISVW